MLIGLWICPDVDLRQVGKNFVSKNSRNTITPESNGKTIGNLEVPDSRHYRALLNYPVEESLNGNRALIAVNPGGVAELSRTRLTLGLHYETPSILPS